MMDQNRTHVYLDPVFPFRHASDPSEINRFGSLFRTFLLQRGPVFLLSDSEKRIVDTSSFIFLPPECCFSLKAGKSAIGSGIMFSRHFLDQLLLSCWKNKALQDFIAGCWQPDRQIRILSLKSPDLYKQYLSKIGSEHEQRPAACETSIMQYTLRILLLLYREHKDSDEKGRINAWQISDALTYIHENYSESFSLHELAEKYSFSPGYFSRIFREKTGQPLFEYINHIRIQKACILLKRTDQPIIEIAFAVGYNNISFFNRYFRKIINMSPREYRNSIKR